MFAQGYSQQEIAKKVGLHQSTISRRLNSDEECQAIVEQTRKQNAQLLPRAFNKHSTLIDSENEKTAMSAIKLTYKTTGILPTRTGDQYFIQNNNQTLVTQDVESLFKLLSGSAAGDEDVIDAELVPPDPHG